MFKKLSSVFAQLTSLPSASLVCVVAALSMPLWAAPTISGLNGTHRTYSAKSMGHGKVTIGISGEGSQDENKLRQGNVYEYLIGYDTLSGVPRDSLSDSTHIDEVLDLTARLFLSVGISNYFDLGVAMPVHFDQVTGLNADANDDIRDARGYGFGDIEIMGKLVYPPYEHDPFWEMALMGIVTLPTGDKTKGFIPKELYYVPKDSTRGTRFWSAQLPSVTLMLLNTVDFQEINRSVPLQWNLNFGMLATTAENLDNIFLLNTSALYQATDMLGLFLEFSGQTRMQNFADGFTLGDDPGLLSAGFILSTPNGISFSLAIDHSIFQAKQLSTLVQDKDPGPRPGDPLCPGTECTGDGKYSTYQVQPAANLGVSAVLSWTGWLVPQDKDKDRILDKDDACPIDPEDMDGFEDHDGCPDKDNDEDGIADLDDRCPIEPEDLDGYMDEDGCPDTDNDGDKILDSKDKCPDQPEDFNSFEDEDGCPDAAKDKDGDGISDYLDKCPDTAEDVDGFEDKDGCPEADNDKDGIVDSLDRCPLAAEVVNGFEDEDGCPDVKPAPKPMLEKKASVALRGVNFQTGSAVLTPESFAQLNDVALSLRENPDVVIEIRGFTDNRGSAKINSKLSQARAQSVVDYLVSQGIKPAQLKATGFGPKMPVASNKTAEGRAMNRRIEMYRVK